ncbi:MAG: hypothetical protein IKX84_02325, partial [Clostridia bacterium]|nr:hypothetical protein [Clostridia bacterium]
SRLNGAGHEAYAVGGCVRDALLAKEPNDWDITTDAEPEEMKNCFHGMRIIETGVKHGTLTVMLHGIGYEVTAYRVDGEYSDHRRPDSVRFVKDLGEDLARRDFTVNAMATKDGKEIIDLFGGQDDLKKGVIRCVGEAEMRFNEDALRILRALRFAACYGLSIEEETAKAMRGMAEDVRLVAGERIRAEMDKLLCGKAAGTVLREYTDVITEIFPALKPMAGFEQHSIWHRYDVWEHSVRAVEAIAPEPLLRWVMLLHDSGKPECFFLDEQGTGHAYGHQQRSAEIAAALFDGMHFDNRTRERALLLIEKHDIPMESEPKLLLRQLNRYGEEAVRQLIAVHCADEKAKGTAPPEKADAWAEEITKALDSLLAQNPCFTLSSLAVKGSDLIAVHCADEKAKGTTAPESADARATEISRALDSLLAQSPCFTLSFLAVKGNDLIATGIAPGKQIGDTLQRLLDAVMDGEVPNERETLLRLAAQTQDP